MSTTTTFYSFYLPGLGDGIKNGHIWGLHIAANFANIDAIFHAMETSKLTTPSGGVDGQLLGRVAGSPAWVSKDSTTHESTHAPAGSDALPWTSIHGRGPTTGKPTAAAGNAGYTYYDTNLSMLQRSNGSAWEPYQGAGGGTSGGTLGDYVIPVFSAFTGYNNSGCIVTEGTQSLSFMLPPHSGDTIRGYGVALPSPPYTLTVCFKSWLKAASTGFGIALLDTVSGKFQMQDNFGGVNRVVNWNNYASASSAIYSGSNVSSWPVIWMRVSENGTNRVWSLSFDGLTWFAVKSVATGNWMTPNVAMFAGSLNSVSDQSVMNLLSWQLSNT